MSLERAQLQYPLDETSKSVLKRTVNDFLPSILANALWDKIYYYHSGFEYISPIDLATGSSATATAGAATLHTWAGTITSEALTTAAGADYTLTLTNARIAATSVVLATADNGTNTTEGLAINRVTPGSGSCVILVRNTHASGALNGTIKINFYVVPDNGSWKILKTGTAINDPSFNNNNVTLRTGSTSGNRLRLFKSSSATNRILFGRKTRFRTQIDLSSVANVTAYVVTGGAFLVGSFGFKVVNASLYGITTNGSGTETLTPVLATLTADTPVEIEARWDPTDNSVTFYIGNLNDFPIMKSVGRLTSGFSAAISDQGTWGTIGAFDITTNTTANKTLSFSTFEFIQEL